jgi:hypothetical protein
MQDARTQQKLMPYLAARMRALCDPHAEVERLVALVRARRIQGVVSTDDHPGSAHAAIVAERLDLPDLVGGTDDT